MTKYVKVKYKIYFYLDIRDYGRRCVLFLRIGISYFNILFILSIILEN